MIYYSIPNEVACSYGWDWFKLKKKYGLRHLRKTRRLKIQMLTDALDKANITYRVITTKTHIIIKGE